MTESTRIAFVGLGANLDDPQRQVQRALSELAALPQTRLTGSSSLYRTAPMGPPDQPDYVNAVARLETQLSADTLLQNLQRIERSHGRVRSNERWGPRTLDLDLLLYGEEQIRRPGLTVPHPGLIDRNFVVLPLLELDPRLSVPGVGTLAEIAVRMSSEGMERLS